MDRTQFSPVLYVVCVLALRPACLRAQDPASAQSRLGTICSYEFLDLADPCVVKDVSDRAQLTFAAFDANDRMVWTKGFEGIDDWCTYAMNDPCQSADKTSQVGWTLSGGKESIFWRLQALGPLCPECGLVFEAIESRPVIYDGLRRRWLTVGIEETSGENHFDLVTGVVFWNPHVGSAYSGEAAWDQFPPLAALAHELVHAYQRIVEDRLTYSSPLQVPAVKYENLVRSAFNRKVPQNEAVMPRPGNAGFYLNSDFQYLFDSLDWADWSPSFVPLLDVFVEQP